MQSNSALPLREYLESLPSERLVQMLRQEVHSQTPDPEAVRLLLRVLEAREAVGSEEATPRSADAWEEYQQRIGARPPRPQARRPRNRWYVTASAAVLVLVLLVQLPQQAEAASFWEMLGQWRNSVLEFFSPGAQTREFRFTFQTDNDAMQQIYDAAVELGVEAPLVPMWFEEAYTLTTCTATHTPTLNGVTASLTNGTDEAIFKIDLYREKPSRGYWGDELDYTVYEREGATYRIARNEERWVAIWIKDYVEYGLTIDCQEDTLQRMLDSIYEMEEP